jgi:rhodanese-related sulfurtransferase
MPSVGAGDTVLSEHLEQREFVSWFRKTYSGVRIFAIPNGGYRSLAAASRLKAEGVSAGVPDLFIPAWRVWIEMKRADGGALSEKQKDWRGYLKFCGYIVIVAHGKKAAQDEIIALHGAGIVK